MDININAEGWPALFFIFASGVVIVALICLAALPALLIAGYSRRKAGEYKKMREGTVIAQYDPPRNLSPAEIGYLYDLKCGEKELYATLFALEQRKIINVTNQKSVEVVDPKSFEKLGEYEKTAVKLFSDRAPLFESVDMGSNGISMTRINLPLHFLQFQTSVKMSLQKKGYKINSLWMQTIVRALIAGAIISLWPILLWLSTGGNSNGEDDTAWSLGAFFGGLSMTLFLDIFFLPIYLAGGFLLVKLWSKIAGNHWVSPKKVRKVWYEIEGYRMFIKQVDLDNIRFDAMGNHDRTVNKTLPYAIALNLDTKWRNYFK